MDDTKDIVELGKTHVVVRGACGSSQNGNAFVDGRDRAQDITAATSAVADEIARLRSENEVLRAHVRDLQASLFNRMTPGLNEVDYGTRDTRTGNGKPPT